MLISLTFAIMAIPKSPFKAWLIRRNHCFKGACQGGWAWFANQTPTLCKETYNDLKAHYSYHTYSPDQFWRYHGVGHLIALRIFNPLYQYSRLLLCKRCELVIDPLHSVLYQKCICLLFRQIRYDWKETNLRKIFCIFLVLKIERGMNNQLWAHGTCGLSRWFI